MFGKALLGRVGKRVSALTSLTLHAYADTLRFVVSESSLDAVAKRAATLLPETNSVVSDAGATRDGLSHLDAPLADSAVANRNTHSRSRASQTQGRRLHSAVAASAAAAVVLSGLVFMASPAQAATPSIVTSNLLMNMDGANVPSSITSGSSTWSSTSPASTTPAGTIYCNTLCGKYSSGGVNGISFTGGLTGQRVNFGTGVGVTPDAMTFETWVNLSAYTSTGWNMIAARQNGSGSGVTSRDWQLSVFSDGTHNNLLRLDSYANDSAGYVAYSSSSIPLNQWMLIGFTISSASSGAIPQFYINGVADPTTGSASRGAGANNSYSSFTLAGDNRTSAQTYNLIGTMSKARLYSTNLSAAQIGTNFGAEAATYGLPSITYKSNGSGAADTGQGILVGGSTVLAANTYTRADYTFAGWNTAQNGSGTSYADGASVSLLSSTTLWAQWATAPPSNTVAPTVSGTAKVGQTLTASTGTWTSGTTPTYSYQWQNSPDGSTWTSISGATSATYTVASSDGAKYVRVQVTATNTTSSATASSATVLVQTTGGATVATGGGSLSGFTGIVPNDSNVYNVTMVSSNLTSGKIMLNSTAAAAATAILGCSAVGTTIVSGCATAGQYVTTTASDLTSGVPIQSFQATGTVLNSAILNNLSYSSSAAQTDKITLYYALGSSTAASVTNYIPIYDNNRLTFHYYAYSATSGTLSALSSSVSASTTQGGLTSPNNWYLITPRYQVEETRALQNLAGAGLTSAQVASGWTSTDGNTFSAPAGTDGFSTAQTFVTFTSTTAYTVPNGYYVGDFGGQGYSSAKLVSDYWCGSSCSTTSNWGQYIVGTSYSMSGYIAETYSTTPLNTGTTGSGLQTVRTVTSAVLRLHWWRAPLARQVST